MNNQNPLIPQGSILEQKNKGRARVKIAVFFVLAIHGIGLMALLMQGCGQSKEPTVPAEPAFSNAPPAFVEPTNPPVVETNPPEVTSPAVVEAPEIPAVPPAPAGATEYTIVKGDYLLKIAKNYHVSVKAILDANPGLEPTKLKIGQKIQIPAPTGPAAAATTGAAPVESAGGQQVYVVKSGDNLTKIAAHYGVTIRALRSANNLRTDSIKVGQKLIIPGKAAAPAAAPATPAEPGPTGEAPATPPGP